MGSPTAFSGSNFTFKAPPDRSDIHDLPCFTNEKAVVLRVALTPEELKEVKRTGAVWVTVLCGKTFYPIFVGSEKTVRSVVVDYGPVWERQDT